MKTYYWSRKPGKFVYKQTGVVVPDPPNFTGGAMEWYETFVETVRDAVFEAAGRDYDSAHMHVNTDVFTILEASFCYRPFYLDDIDKKVRCGIIDNKLRVMRDSQLVECCVVGTAKAADGESHRFKVVVQDLA